MCPSQERQPKPPYRIVALRLNAAYFLANHKLLAVLDIDARGVGVGHLDALEVEDAVVTLDLYGGLVVYNYVVNAGTNLINCGLGTVVFQTEVVAYHPVAGKAVHHVGILHDTYGDLIAVCLKDCPVVVKTVAEEVTGLVGPLRIVVGNCAVKVLDIGALAGSLAALCKDVHDLGIGIRTEAGIHDGIGDGIGIGLAENRNFTGLAVHLSHVVAVAVISVDAHHVNTGGQSDELAQVKLVSIPGFYHEVVAAGTTVADLSAGEAPT